MTKYQGSMHKYFNENQDACKLNWLYRPKIYLNSNINSLIKIFNQYNNSYVCIKAYFKKMVKKKNKSIAAIWWRRKFI